jgi:alginate O-acetyltransferase complex protein AlgI
MGPIAVHGTFLMMERFVPDRRPGSPTGLGSLWILLTPILRSVYTLGVVIVGWVIFRCENLLQAKTMLRAMVGADRAVGHGPDVRSFLTADVVLILGVGVVLSTPVYRLLSGRYAGAAARPTLGRLTFEGVCSLIGLVALGSILVLSSMSLASGTHNPFIYFRF